MILELDCGNTCIKWRVRDRERIVGRGRLLTQVGIDSMDVGIWAAWKVDRVLISSVLGESYAVKLMNWAELTFGIGAEFAVSAPACNGIVNGYHAPEKLGVDRWLGILSARNHVAGSFILVDCGSAITVDLVNASGEHLGGYIAPGLRLLRSSLNANTAALKLDALGLPDSEELGCDTESAILAAEFIMVKALVDTAKAILTQKTDDVVDLIATGGDGQWLIGIMNGGCYQEDLVLEGLSIALDKGDPNMEGQK